MDTIALYLPSMNSGGAEKVSSSLANFFIKEGFKVDLLLTKKTGIFLTLLDDNINVVELSGKRVALDIIPLLNYLKRSSPRVIISSMTHCNLLLSIAAVLFKKDCKYIGVEHTNFSQAIYDHPYFKRVLIKTLIKNLYSQLDGIISVSSGVKSDFILHFPKLEHKIEVIYNPFDLKFIRNEALKNCAHIWLQPDRAYKTILSIGRLTDAKDYKNLIKAIKIVSKTLNTRLIILGEGELEDDLKSYILSNNLSDVINMAGFVANPFSYLSRADVYVLSSKHEGLPSSLIEALICNTPIVSTDCPSGPSEVLQDGEWGDLVPVGDSEALSQAIINVLSKQKSKLDTSDRALDFSVNNIGNKYIAYIDRV